MRPYCIWYNMFQLFKLGASLLLWTEIGMTRLFKMIFLTISYLHENTWTGEILNLPDCNKKCTVICKNWIVWFSLNLQFRVIKTNATIPYHKFKFNNCEKKEVNLRSLYFTYFPNYVCNLQYDTNKKLYKSAISHPIGWNKTQT